MSIGTLGCNFRCIHCQNWQIAHASAEKIAGCDELSPDSALRMAKQFPANGVAWTYNEPTIWLEYTLESAKLFKKNNLYTVYVTNGYITQEALDTIGPYLDAYRVDIKGFTKDFYLRLSSIKDFSPILKASVRAKEKWDMHVEIVTNIIPTMNDDEKQIRDIARWIFNHLGKKTPWHVTRFFPYLKLSHLPPTPIKVIEKARQIGLEEGLEFVYIGNVPGHAGENTYCPKCKKLVIERWGYQIRSDSTSNGKCKFCNEYLNIRL